MRSAVIILGGLVLLALFVWAARYFGTDSAVAGRAALYFVPLWVLLAAINMWVGVKSAGYSVAEEAPIFAVIAAIPTVVALVLPVEARARLTGAAYNEQVRLASHARALC